MLDCWLGSEQYSQSTTFSKLKRDKLPQFKTSFDSDLSVEIDQTMSFVSEILIFDIYKFASEISL